MKPHQSGQHTRTIVSTKALKTSLCKLDSFLQQWGKISLCFKLWLTELRSAEHNLVVIGYHWLLLRACLWEEHLLWLVSLGFGWKCALCACVPGTDSTWCPLHLDQTCWHLTWEVYKFYIFYTFSISYTQDQVELEVCLRAFVMLCS